MDYKKLYEKAVERAETLTNSGFNDFDFVKHIFPELAESEDEKIRNEITEFLKKASGGFLDTTTQCKTFGKWLTWLKKQGEKKPVWSEEDETMTTNIIIMLKEGASLHFNKNDIAKGVDWLKSLKHQKQWKPNDRQIKALKEACDEHWEPDGLDSLYVLWEQLKKLREE